MFRGSMGDSPTYITTEKNKIELPKGRGQVKPEDIPGYHLGIHDTYPNIACLAPKKSGKTIAIGNLAINLIGPKTVVYIFSPTFSHDPSHDLLKKYLRNNLIEFYSFNSIFDNGQSKLIEILNAEDKKMKDEIRQKRKGLQAQKESPTKEQPSQSAEEIKQKVNKILNGTRPNKKNIHQKNINKVVHIKISMPIPVAAVDEDENTDEDDDYLLVDGEEENDTEISKTTQTKKYPRVLLIIDDLSDELRRGKNIETLYKRNRHSQIITIVGSQSIGDLSPKALANLDYVLLWGGLPDKSLEEVYKKINKAVSYEDFLQIYRDATAQKYNFLFIDVWGKTFQKNFG